MKTLLTTHLTILTILAFSFYGCASKVEPKVIVKIEYIKRPLPVLEEKPKPLKYEMIQVNFNSNDYYCSTKEDAVILESNWISYRTWADTNYQHLLNMKNDDNLSD
jgi:hypothetical protein